MRNKDGLHDFVDDMLAPPAATGAANSWGAGCMVVQAPAESSDALELAERENQLRGGWPVPFFDDDDVQEKLSPPEIAMIEARGFTEDEWLALHATAEGRMAFVTTRAEIAAETLSKEIEAKKWIKAGLYPTKEGTPK